jgi:intein-encoded DNA endonuclease-like protein
MKTKISVDKEKYICELYDNGTGTNEIARILKIHRTTVQKYLIKNSIRLRKTSPYKNKYNVKYFNEYTDENCYWAGFILADGCIRSDRDALEIHLMESDKEHLLKFAKAINFNGNLQYDKCSKAYSISVAGEWYPLALKDNFSIGPKKSLTASFPEQVPQEYWPHLIRGYFDGDGSIEILYQKNGREIPQISFIGTITFLVFLREIFYNIGVRLKSKNKYAPIIPHEFTEEMGYIAYSGINAMKILHYMMDNIDPNNRLDRKYSRFFNFIEGYYE